MKGSTFIMRPSISVKLPPCAKTGVPRRVAAGATHSAGCCCGVRGSGSWQAVRDLCRGRNSKAIRTHRDYFIKNQSRMAYAKLMGMKLPIGSGAIESTVRRVVNLRLKGASLFWCRASAEAILLLRSYYKAGRWNQLKRMATSHLALLES